MSERWLDALDKASEVAQTLDGRLCVPKQACRVSAPGIVPVELASRPFLLVRGLVETREFPADEITDISRRRHTRLDGGASPKPGGERASVGHDVSDDVDVGDHLDVIEALVAHARSSSPTDDDVQARAGRLGVPSLLFLPRRRKVGAHALERLGGEPDRFGERRVRMDRAADVDRVRAHLDRERDLADQIARVRADDAAADDPVRRFVEQELREAFVAAVGDRASRRRPRKEPLDRS